MYEMCDITSVYFTNSSIFVTAELLWFSLHVIANWPIRCFSALKLFDTVC